MGGELDILQILLQSGVVVKIVLLLLVACSVVSWAIIFEKKKKINKVLDENLSFINFFNQTTNLGEINEQAEYFKASSVGVMFRCGNEELNKIKEKLSDAGKEKDLKQYINYHGMEALERSLKKGAGYAHDELQNRLSTLASIGSISPFIGLFGTVWGIIDSFAGLAKGGGSIEAVAPGIAEALVATAVGLAAAIPAVWAYNYFNNRLEKLHTQMEAFGQDFLNLVQRTILINKD